MPSPHRPERNKPKLLKGNIVMALDLSKMTGVISEVESVVDTKVKVKNLKDEYDEYGIKGNKRAVLLPDNYMDALSQSSFLRNSAAIVELTLNDSALDALDAANEERIELLS